MAVRQDRAKHPRCELHRRLHAGRFMSKTASSRGRCRGSTIPQLEAGIPPYEPRGCQRGISYSWYLYSPLRVKYPYIRGALVDLWRKARAESRRIRSKRGPVWSMTRASRQRWQRARGKGGLRRTDWDTVLEIIAASLVHTIKKHGPDRIAGFSPIPAMSMISYASGARLMQLMGGVSLSFYDWYCDLPTASPETWGEQTDVAESRRLVPRQAAGRDGCEPEHDAHARTATLPPRRGTTARRCGSSRPTSARFPSTPTSGSA